MESNPRKFLSAALLLLSLNSLANENSQISGPPVFALNFLTHSRTENPDLKDPIATYNEKSIHPAPSGLLNIKTFFGAYASVFRMRLNKYLIFHTQSDGIHRVITNSKFRVLNDTLVASNSLIYDSTEFIKDKQGHCIDSHDRKNVGFQRITVIKDIDGKGYVAVATVMNNYYSPCRTNIPAWLTSPDGINWIYHGKFKGEPSGLEVLNSGMALIILPHGNGKIYRYYTDSYKGKLTALESQGDNNWTFVKDDSPIAMPIGQNKNTLWQPAYNAKDFISQIIPKTGYERELSVGGTFSSAVKVKNRYYMIVTPYPLYTSFLAESFDGNTWRPVYIIKDNWYALKNINLFEDKGSLMGLATEWRLDNANPNVTRQDKLILEVVPRIVEN